MHERWPTNDRTWRILLRTGPIKNGSKESDWLCQAGINLLDVGRRASQGA
jgi:hypothetical protein